MATGKSFAPIAQAEGAIVPHFDLKEASVQTFTLGAPVAINASGNIAEMATNASALYGFAARAGQNGASDGAKNAKVLRAAPGQRFRVTLSVTSLAQSHIGSAVALAIASSSWYAATLTAISSIAQLHVVGIAPRFALGDSMPEVIVTVNDDAIQYYT